MIKKIWNVVSEIVRLFIFIPSTVFVGYLIFGGEYTEVIKMVLDRELLIRFYLVIGASATLVYYVFYFLLKGKQ